MCVLKMGISGGRGGCKLLFPWVTWLSLGLHPTGKDEVRGLLRGGVISKAFPGLPAVGFGLVPLQAGWFLARPLCSALGMGGAAHPCATSSSAWVTCGGSRANPTLLLLWGP